MALAPQSGHAVAHFAIDRGGTFTDVYAQLAFPDGTRREVVTKLLSLNPKAYPDAPIEGIRRILKAELDIHSDAKGRICTENIGSIRIGTTVGTNALLERKGERFCLMITKGFGDLLYIRHQARPKLFELDIKVPDVLYDKVVEVDERVLLLASAEQTYLNLEIVEGVTGEKLKIARALDEVKMKAQLAYEYSLGYRSLAVCFLHSYAFRSHEETVKRLALEVGFQYVIVSSDVSPLPKIVPRGLTTCMEAYLKPVMAAYSECFLKGFDENIRNVPFHIVQSDGTLAEIRTLSAARCLLSGPAAGVIGSIATTYERFGRLPIIGFDMGGTSTDVSYYDGKLDTKFESNIADYDVQLPQLDIHTVAAGGGSCLIYRDKLLFVGPESVGSLPGPICYRNNGRLSITDANLLLGRIAPDHFPAIFGAEGDLPLDLDATRKEFEALSRSIGTTDTRMLPEDIALGFIRVADESMCQAVRSITEAKGLECKNGILSCFGGASGQHACAIAENLGLNTIFIHRYASVLSAFGLSMAKIVEEEQLTMNIDLESLAIDNVAMKIKDLGELVRQRLAAQIGSKSHENVLFELVLGLKYDGTDHILPIVDEPVQSLEDVANVNIRRYRELFQSAYSRQFGFIRKDRSLVVQSIMLRAIASSSTVPTAPSGSENVQYSPAHAATKHQVYFARHGWTDTPIFQRDRCPNSLICGPALIVDRHGSIVVHPDWTAEVDQDFGVTLKKPSSLHIPLKPSQEHSIVRLSIYAKRFMNIAEQMGHALQKTAVSTNIKERLDFSCAVFDATGNLVSNAPHIPVHLGSMQSSVEYQLQTWSHEIRPGDVLLSNHPMAGGTHLPDVTVITPVFDPSGSTILFFVGSRGHHADIGGISPGSMPSESKHLWQEGMAVRSIKIVACGVFQEEALREAFVVAPAKYQHCSGARHFKDNLSDIQAQIAANNKGVELLGKLLVENGIDDVQNNMSMIRENAAESVRSLFRRLASTNDQANQILVAEDQMDDGSIIKLRVCICAASGMATFDFSGTSTEVYGNWNAPPAITSSAVMYCLRCMVSSEIPLNQGCLEPVNIVLPQNCFLNPSEDAAVVGGNVLTSQRLVDVIFRAFGTCAASHGCCNNFTFGNEKFGYYETIGGGAGAGPTWHGQSGIHVHMTNTRITDPEIIERRYPVILRRFGLRRGSGGRGKYNGGDGLVREIEFCEKMRACLLTERRAIAPYGMAGGQPGQRGLNLFLVPVERSNFQGKCKTKNVGGKCSLDVSPGDRIVIHTAGGGGYGADEGNC